MLVIGRFDRFCHTQPAQMQNEKHTQRNLFREKYLAYWEFVGFFSFVFLGGVAILLILRIFFVEMRFIFNKVKREV